MTNTLCLDYILLQIAISAIITDRHVLPPIERHAINKYSPEKQRCN